MLREYQSQLSVGAVQDASFLRRPDAVVPLVSLSFGPRAESDTSEGLLARAWYCRVDNAAGKVYLARARDVGPGWEDEEEWFSFAGAPIDEIDLSPDQNGRFMAVAERAGNLWIYYFKPIAGAFVFEDFGAGRSPRCILDDPINPSRSDILVFYVASGTIRIRTQSDLYAVPVDTAHPMTSNQAIEKIIRDGSLRLHVWISERDPVTGRYSLDPLSSLLYPYYAEDEALDVTLEGVSGELKLLVIPWVAAAEALDLSVAAMAGSLLLAVQDESVGPDEMNVASQMEGIDVYLFVISYAATTEELDVSHAPISGVLELKVILYTATTESLDLTLTPVSGTLQGDGAPVSSALIAHHDAQALSGYANDDQMLTFPDESGNGNSMSHYRNFATLYKAAGINGYPAVYFGTSTMKYASAFMSAETEGEIFVVLANAANGAYGLWRYSQSDYNAHHLYSNTIYETWGRATRVTVGAIPGGKVITNPHLYNVASKSGEYTVRYDGTQLYTTATNTPAFLPQTSTGDAQYPQFGQSGAGTSDNGYGWAGYVGEILVYDRVLTTTERAEVESYLNAKWGL